MARIKPIHSVELVFLRKAILEAYAHRNPHESQPALRAYLPNYDDLKTDMQDFLPDQAASISQNRLRKLFYYTNPEVLEQEKLKAANFGLDFLDACYRYATEGQFNREQHRRRYTRRPLARRSRRLMLVSVPVIAVLVTYLMYCNEQATPPLAELPMTEQFDDVSLQTLSDQGWQVLDLDTAFFNAQRKQGAFTLYTLPGSYWVKQGEPKTIANTLVHSLPASARGVRACFEAFLPYHDWQGAGLVFFDRHLDKDQIVIVSFGYAEDFVEEGLPPYVYCAYIVKNGIPQSPFHTLNIDPEKSTGNALRFDVDWSSGQFDISLGINSENGFSDAWDAFIHFGTIDMPFDPAYVGVYATQGWTDDNGQILRADTIPVYLDWLEIY